MAVCPDSKKNLVSCDCMPLHPFAAKVPAVRKCSDSDVMQERTNARKAQVKVIDALMKYPEISLDVWATVEGKVQSHLNKQELDKEESWSDQYRKLMKLPTYWMASWIIARAGGRLTTEQVDATTRAKGENFIRECFFFLTATHGSDSLPKQMLRKHVCASAFNIRASGVGDRIGRLLSSGVFRGEQVDWSDFGPFDIEWDADGKALSIQHISGDKVVLDPKCAEGQFSKDWTLHHGHSDNDAFVKGKKMAKYNLRDYFEGDGPHKVKITAGEFAEIAARAEAEIDRKKADLDCDKIADDKTVLPDQASLKRSAALVRARTMLANKRAKQEAGVALVKPEMKVEGEDPDGLDEVSPGVVTAKFEGDRAAASASAQARSAAAQGA